MDLVINKLRWAKDSMSERQLADVGSSSSRMCVRYWQTMSSTMLPSSNDGSGGLGFSEGWTPVERRDTRPEAAAAMREIARKRTPEERAAAVMQMQYVSILAKYRDMALRHPGASEAELDALWVEEMYGDSIDPRLLAKACAIIRSRDAPASEDPRQQRDNA